MRKPWLRRNQKVSDRPPPCNRNGPKSDWIALSFDPQTMYFRPDVFEKLYEKVED